MRMMEENIIKTGVIEVKFTDNCGTGKAIQMNNDVEPIKNI